jgi:molybdopterin synthase catalytic subunit
MKIRLLAFASAGDALGAAEMDLELANGSRVSDLRARLDRDHPRIAPLWSRLAVAMDGRIVSPGELLRDGAEVALLPPVSGGGGEPLRAELVNGPIDVAGAVAAVSSPGRGAVVVLLGTVRDHHAGRPVEKLTYSAYRAMALEGLHRIVADLESAHQDLRAAIVHRLGARGAKAACSRPLRTRRSQVLGGPGDRVGAELRSDGDRSSDCRRTDRGARG